MNKIIIIHVSLVPERRGGDNRSMTSALWCALALVLCVGMSGCKAVAYFDQHNRQEDGALEAKYIFVLFTQSMEQQNPNVKIFTDISYNIQSKYNSSTLFWVRSFNDKMLVDWEHHCANVDEADGGGYLVSANDCLVCFEMPLIDRTCLMTPPLSSPQRVAITYTGKMGEYKEMEKFIKIESEVYLQDLFRHDLNPSAQLYSLSPVNIAPPAAIQCAEVDSALMDFNTFFHDYWLSQKPVVIRNVMDVSNLPLLDILSKFKHVNVGAKLSPDIEFEGVDSLLNWEMAGEQDVPKKVLEQLQSPDLVIVRAAHEDMTLGRVLSLLTKTEKTKTKKKIKQTKKSSDKGRMGNTSATNVYVEYMQLDTIDLSPLYNDLLNITHQEQQQACSSGGNDEHSVDNSCSKNNSKKYPGFPEWVSALKDGSPFLWLGDGRAIGKMHFDPFDNLLLQLEGRKSFKLIDTSDNRRLYEGHMREAQLEAFKELGSTNHDIYSFRKHRLLESTSMVHTPIDLTKMTESFLKSFPRAKDIPSVDCDVGAGDMLFVPSFWWHEVASSPGTARRSKLVSGGDPSVQLNVAINHWFNPLFLKEYPCATCKKYLNKKYGSMLVDIFGDATATT